MQTPTHPGHLARALAVLTLTVTLALTLAACGGSSDGAGAASTSATPDATASGEAASADASMIVSNAQLTDLTGNQWTLAGGVISVNGVVQPATHKVIVLVYDNGVIYQENSDCQWLSWSSGTWVAATQPAGAGIPACPATTTAGESTSTSLTASANSGGGAASNSGSMILSGAHLVDAAGNSWTLSDDVISLNGVVQTVTHKVLVLLYYNGVIYQENSDCLWWNWTNSAWATTTAPAVAGVPPCTGGSSSSSSSSSSGSGATSGSSSSSSSSGGSGSPTASASGSMIPALTQLLDTSGNTWTVSGGVISLNGTVQTVTHKVVLMLYYQGVIYQENSDCLWWNWSGGAWVATAKPAAAGIPSCSSGVASASSGGSGSSGSSSSGGPAVGGVPAAAAAVGYSTMTYGPAVTLASNWYPWNFYGASNPGPSSQNADGSVYLSGVGNLNSASNIATASHTNSGKNWTGTAFGGGGYFEAVLSFTGQGDGPYLGGGPTWWALDIEHTSQGPYNVSWPNMPNDSNGNPYDDFYEVDFMEYDVHEYSYQNGIGNWYGYPPTKSTSNPYEAVGGSTGSVMVPNGTNFAQNHAYGCLWVPATPSTQGYLKFYFDGVQTGETFYWNYNNPNNPFPAPPIDNSTAMSGMDARHLMLMLGTGSTQPMTVKSVTVWQASGANNLTE